MESNYPSAKTDTSPDAGPSPGQADVRREVCADCSCGGSGKGVPEGPLWDGRWPSTHHGETGKGLPGSLARAGLQ